MDTKKEEWVTLEDQGVGGIVGLQTKKSSRRLNQIDRIRATGVGDHISLPQLVVCGDQSAGKSSVLEAITNIPFPRQEGLCTRFATEIIIRHQPDTNRITAKILPGPAREENDRQRISSFERQLTSYEDLPRVIQEASATMGIAGDSGDIDVNGPTFSADTLRLEVVGDTKIHLTVVDLPGLISVSENPADVQIVSDMVDRYLESSRTIILAVVPAGIDIDTQGIIQKARQFDPNGERTVGIITKPDLINKGTESRVANLAMNKDRIKLKLGFFLLKNPTPLQLRQGLSWAERQQQEMEFFRTSPWKEQNLDMTRVGIENLRCFLQGLLDSHIERELPKVRQEAKALLSSTQSQLATIGPERSSVEQVRIYLTRMSMEFSNVIKAAVDGNYEGRDSSFFERLTIDARLRAKVHLNNERFASDMKIHAAKRRVVAKDEDQNGKRGPWLDSEPESEDLTSGEESGGDQIRLTKKQMLKWIEQIYRNTRGRELPGNYSHALLSELFHEQSSRWGKIAELHLESVNDLVEEFIHAALGHVIADDQVRSGVKRRVGNSLDMNLQSAHEELKRLLLDEKVHPITYNHYYTDNIQNARMDAARQQLQNSMDASVTAEWNGKLHVSNTAVDLQKFTSSLKSRVVVNMTQQACVESLAALDAYYKVAMKTFVDNICRQVIERHLLRDLTTVFDPVSVGLLTEDELVEVAAETVQVRDRRNELDALRKTLRETLAELRD